MTSLATDINLIENLLVERYVKEAMSGHEVDLTKQTIEKARAINEPLTLWILATHYLDSQNHVKATEYFIAAFDLGLRNPDFLYKAEDCLLRHGSRDQYQTFFLKLLQENPGHTYIHFMLKTLDFYQAAVDKLQAQIGRNYGSSKPKIILNATFWGSKYANIFLNYSLAALMSRDNIPHLSESYEIHLVLATTRDDLDRLQQDELFRRMKCYLVVHFLELPPDLLDFALSFAKSVGGGWCIPVTMLTNAQQYAVIECARLLGADLLVIYPDHILTDSFLSDLLPEGHQHSAIAGLCFRFHYDLSLLGAIDAHKGGDGLLKVDSQMLCRWLLEYLPEENYVDHPNFSTFPIYLCWRVGNDGLIAHVNHYCLWFLRGADLRGPIHPSLDPIDGFFLDRYLADNHNVGLAPEKVIAFDLGNNPMVTPLDGTPFSSARVADWLRPWLTDVHQNYFEKTMKYSSTGEYLTPEWEASVEAARRTVQEIIELAKRPRQVLHD